MSESPDKVCSIEYECGEKKVFGLTSLDRSPNGPCWIVGISAWKSRENDPPSQTMIFFLLFEEVYDYQCHASDIYRRVGLVKDFFHDDINEPLLPNGSWKEFTMM